MSILEWVASDQTYEIERVVSIARSVKPLLNFDSAILDDGSHSAERKNATVAQVVLETYLRDDDGNLKPWLFPQHLAITKDWRRECLTLKDDTFPQLLLWVEFATSAAEKIYQSIVSSTPGEKLLKPILYPYDTEDTTRFVDFDTARHD